MTTNKNTKIVLGLAFIFTIAMMLLGTMMSSQNRYSSNLLEESASGTLFSGELSFSADPSLLQFPIEEKESEVRKKELALRTGSGAGLYFPSLYTLYEKKKGLVVLSYMSQIPLSLEQSLQITLEYPERYLQYLGESVKETTKGIKLVSLPKFSENLVTIELQNLQSSPNILPFDSLLALPFEPNVFQPGMLLKMRIRDVKMKTFTGQLISLPFDASPASLFAIADDRGYAPTRVAMTAEQVRTDVPIRSTSTLPVLMPSAPVNTIPTTPSTRDTSTAATTTSATGSQIFTSSTTSSPTTGSGENITSTNATSSGTIVQDTPVVVPGSTKLSPSMLVLGKGETFFLYMEVDTKSAQIDEVLLDAKTLGITEPMPLRFTENKENNNIVDISGSFYVSERVPTVSETYELLLTLRTSKGPIIYPLLLKAKPLEEPSQESQTTTGSTIELDLNQDGRVDMIDLTLFLEAYKKATGNTTP